MNGRAEQWSDRLRGYGELVVLKTDGPFVVVQRRDGQARADLHVDALARSQRADLWHGPARYVRHRLGLPDLPDAPTPLVHILEVAEGAPLGDVIWHKGETRIVMADGGARVEVREQGRWVEAKHADDLFLLRAAATDLGELVLAAKKSFDDLLSKPGVLARAIVKKPE